MVRLGHIRGESGVSTCVHNGAAIFHNEPVCPICKGVVRRARYIHDLEAALIDVVKESGGDPGSTNAKVVSAWKRVENLIGLVHGGAINGAETNETDGTTTDREPSDSDGEADAAGGETSKTPSQ